MSRHLVYMSWGHIGRVAADISKGATHDNKWEVLYIPHYIQSMSEVFLKKGIHCMVDGVDAYSKRHTRATGFASGYTKVAYLSCHLNWFPQDRRQRPMFFYDYRSSGGRRLASSIVESIRTSWTEPRPPNLCASMGDDWTRNAFHCIRGVYSGPKNISAVCCEPLAMNGEPAVTVTSVKKIGKSIAHGVIDWLEQ